MANTIIRWNPNRDLSEMQAAIDRIFNDANRNSANSLPLDVRESEDAYTIIADVPGVATDAININLHDNVLSISVELPGRDLAEGTRTLRQERFTGKLARRIQLRNEVAADAIEALYDAGVLTLTLPKAEAAKPRTIPVQAGAMPQAVN